MDAVPTTRLAPSPTGGLHLGNARTFVANWALARQHGGRVLMRIEDVAPTSTTTTWEDDVLGILQWLGLDWDGPPLIQSAELPPHQQALNHLAQQGLVFQCSKTRKELVLVTAPQEGDFEARYAPELRPEPPWPRDPQTAPAGFNWRVKTSPGEVPFTDEFAGPQSFDPHREVGDFILWTKRGQPSYQLACVVDDHRTGVNMVFRGDDLLSSTSRQILLSKMLGWDSPKWWHVPLVLDEQGERLAKRNKSIRLTELRDAGVRPESILRLLAKWCGHKDPKDVDSIQDFLEGFSIDQMPRTPVRCTQHDLAELHER
ncbi:MAG: tRNA glutamyl-Q(34) synthetase GluQRS [Phycisphaerae bacterium]|jgi:glutamyl-tRNA synthetase|nr:tRNA glutamyl-Q(34) synthetase GluQRS [Phycisphaerae bacterium]